MKPLDLTVDVTGAAGLGEEAAVGLTVHLPAPGDLCQPPVVCFAKPGAGFSRAYFTGDLPGAGCGGQADWHAARGWVFVSVDHLGTGGSSAHHDPRRLDSATLAAASQAAEREVLGWLREGTLHDRFGPLREPVVLGIGQSMGGCLTVVQQDRYNCYDGIAVLGFSAVHTTHQAPPGDHDFASALSWLFFYDDLDADQLRTSLPGMSAGAQVPPWVSVSFPGAVDSVLTPGIIAAEAATVAVPVLVAMGERDVIADPKDEPRAYSSATSVDLFVCPRMAHMHNFAGTRELLWRRIETWAAWVAAALPSEYDRHE
jgi:alpha-beta hydrolase superfamily lysophospholipase